MNKDREQNIQKALEHAYFFLKFRSRTEKEIRNYLLKKKRFKWGSDIIESVIFNLKEENLVNDKEFILKLVDERCKYKPKGEFALRYELIRHGVDRKLIDEYFLENPINEEKLAFKALSSKWHVFESLPLKKQFEKAIQFLGRRGFSYELSKNSIAQMHKKE